MDTHVSDPPPRPPIAQAPLSVILLADGPTSEAAESVSAWAVQLGRLARPFELLLLPLTDLDTNPVLADARRLDYDAKRGYGPAVQAAIRSAKHPLIVMATADRQYQPDDLPRLLAVIDNVDLVLGCRSVHRRFWRRALRWVFVVLGWVLIGLPLQPPACTPGATPWQRRWVARWLFGLRLYDPECAFRLGRREALVRIVLQSRGRFALVEQLAKANHLEFILAEERVTWNRPASAPAETVPFGPEARELFRCPDFGPPELHIPPYPRPVENPATGPTEPAAPSS
jgi:hypothetical protein